MAGLQDIAPTVEKRCVTRAVVAPIRAAAAAASQPAWPPPITMTSKLSRSVRMGGLLAQSGKSRKWKLGSRLFHVKRGWLRSKRFFLKTTPCTVEGTLKGLLFHVKQNGPNGENVYSSIIVPPPGGVSIERPIDAARHCEQRSNPESLRGGSLDGFVARAPRNDEIDT